ncbi:MAG: ORF6N domain-containing protein [Bacteroidetes bacterium]|nr:ORF6N domain-containing protein [Bacteroidota bacterium]
MKNELAQISEIQNRIYSIRGVQVMLDSDLAKMYGVETKILNRAVSRNIKRFPEKFRFQLTQIEFDEFEKFLRSQFGTLKSKNESLRFQNGTSKKNRGGRRYLPYVFTEQGVSMLSAVLRSDTAIEVSISIINAFVEMRKFISENAGIFQRLDKVEQKLLQSDENFNKLFNALEDKSIKPKQDIFFNGQIFDAYSFVSDLIRTAKTSIILIDNYIDDTVLTHFAKRKKAVSFTILTKTISKQLSLDIKKHNEQYKSIVVKEFKDAHDRFLIIDEKKLYHFGASLKDLGKKWFAFSKMDISSVKVLDKLKEEGLI